MKNNALPEKGLKLLSRNPTVEEKNKTVKKISEHYRCGKLTEKGKKIAEDIFLLMVEDSELKVRKILAESLKDFQNIPHKVVRRIINDQDCVAIPFIKFSPSLTRDDMIKIIDSKNPEKQKAVAERENLHEEVSHHIADKCTTEIVGILISNSSAKIKENTYDAIINKYKEGFNSDNKIEALVKQLYDSHRLNGNIAVRAICMGDLKFFEYALAYLSNTPLAEVRKILLNAKVDFMIRNLLRKASIKKNMFHTVFGALKVVNTINFDCRNLDKKDFTHQVIERVLSFENATQELNNDDIHYLISKIS